MARSRVLLSVAVLAATAVLVGLGVWQVQRLAWKEALIARVEARIAAPPSPLAGIEARWATDRDVDYLPVSARGTFDHSREVRFYTTHGGQVGWSVMTPLALQDGRWLIVNRGFVPDRLRNPATRAQGQVAGTVEVTGLAREPLFDKPNAFVPDNRPERREFFWKSFPQIAAAMGLDIAATVPFFVDAGAEPAVPGGWPLGGTTLVAFPNNHLQYALTWFGLAAACLGVGGWFLFGWRDGGA